MLSEGRACVKALAESSLHGFCHADLVIHRDLSNVASHGPAPLRDTFTVT